ncbi:hypothetical protein J6590_082350 [Homalodisca vitripennis]|nr:hypothetical protein J6590_082350 [Homalodisca vitripennis]
MPYSARRESIQYKVDGTDKKCNGHRQDRSCAISNSVSKSNVLDHSAIGTPTRHPLEN